MRRRFGLLVVFALAIFLSCANSVFAQAGIATARLSGTVSDQSGGVVGKAEITVRNVDTNVSYTATSNENGFYVVPNLAPGNYELKASFTGFAGFTQTGIVLTVGQSATVDVALQLAAAGEKVVVTSEVPVIEPTKTEISQVIETKQIGSLPISGRLFTDFALLTPGVATSRTSMGTTFTEFETTQISFGGMRSFSNEITVDGADFVNELSGVQRATPPQDSVQEFRVVNNSFGAEYGRAIGGIVNVVTKSGTNELHGSVYDYFHNSYTDSRSLLQPAPLPNQLRHNQFGGTLSGPISKDKTFFFVNYEGKRHAESPTYPPDLVNNLEVAADTSSCLDAVVSSRIRPQGILCAPFTGINPAKIYLGLSPEGCNLPPAECLLSSDAYLGGFLKTNDNDYGFARLDHQINANNRLAIRYLVEDSRNLGELVGNTLDGGGIGTPSGGRNLFIRDQSVVGTLDSSLTPNVINSAMGQYARRHYNFPGSTGEPDLSVVNALELGHNFGTYDAIYESRVEGADSVSWVKGNHVAKFGFDGNYVWDMTNFPGFTPTRILFPNLNCLIEFANDVNFVEGPPLAQLSDQPGCPAPGGVDFVYWGQALPRTGFANGYVPLPATGGGPFSGWPNAFPTNQYENYAYYLNHGYWGVFVQDQWRITPKLTFNYGLRWDYESGLGKHIDADYNAFQPRVGLAYSPDSKTVIRAGFGIFFDRNNMTFFFTPGGQKTIPGFMCNPVSADPSCAGVTAVKMPMVRDGADTAGWQLGGLPGVSGAAGLAYSILAGNPYPPSVLSGTCNPEGDPPTFACGVGAGGMDRHHSRLPYAQQASVEIDRQFGGGFALNFGYLFVGAHKLVRGNNINVPCPVGTMKSGNPADVQTWLNPDGTLSPCEGTPAVDPLGLGPVFRTLPFSEATATSTCPLPYQTPIPFPPNVLGYACIGNPTGLGFAGAPFNPSALSAGLLDYNNDVANAAYHGLTVTAIERWGKYLNLTANYTFSHTIDNGNFTTFINLPPNQFNYASERANSNQDVRHRFVTNFTVDAPKESFLRNFQFSSIITLQAGRPFTIYAGENTLGDLAGSSTDRTGGSPVIGTCASVDKCSTLIGRNTYIGDPLYSWDLRVSRAIHLTERLKLDLMMDIFNVLNRANVDEVSSIYGPVFCGSSPVIPRHYNDATTLAIQDGSVSCATQQAATVGSVLTFPGGAYLERGLIPVVPQATPNASFGKPRTMLNPRQFQFAAKFSF